MRRFNLVLSSISFTLVTGAAVPALAQTATDIAGCRVSVLTSSSAQRVPVKTEDGLEEYLQILTGGPAVPVQVDCDEMQFFADHAQVFPVRHRVVATGNVLFVSGGNRISAERMDFDTQSRTGTFYNASGIVTLGERVDRSFFGTQEPDAYFWGEEVRKVGPKKYQIKSGGFTTCVQPTPRWEISSGNVTLNMDDYALLKNSVLRVKGVPLMYLPIFYYPIQEDDRATGFLIPTYGTSTVRGQTLSNAFFWAIGRSHDATLFHDWFTKTGQGFGGEYRYELGGGSQGTVRSYLINENATTYQQSDGSSVQSPAKRSYQVNGGVTQGLPGNLRARANVDYFSDVVTQQRYQQNVYQATNRTRRFGGNVTGNWGEYLLSATLERNDVFYGEDTLTTNGGLPRINFSRAERAIGRAPLYFGIGGEYVTLLRSTTRRDVKVDDRGLTRVDVNPILRIPFTRWPFLTINSAIAWRGTYWSESRNGSGVQVPEGLNRRFFDFQARVTGPVFTRIWNTPDNGYAEKFKHVIEPTFGVQRITAIDVFDQIVQLEGTDYIVGGVTRFNYGLNNRLYAKKNVAREILTVALTQSYYTDARAAQYDQHYQSSFGLTRPSKFSAVRLIVRGSPTDRLQAEFSTEYDPNVRTLRTYAATGSINGAWVQASGGWSQRRYLPGLPGFDNPDLADHYLNASVNVRQPGNRLGGSYSFNYDLRRDTFLQQRFLAYYNAQCCGIGVEYQTFNFRQAFIGLPVPQDRRFNISFTLAGIGTFSNFLGAFGGQQGR